MLHTFQGLVVMQIRGFAPTDGGESDPADRPGSIEWLCRQKMTAQPDERPERAGPGIIWTQDRPGRPSAILADVHEVESLREFAEGNGYRVVDEVEVTEPQRFGDKEVGFVTILRSPDGWVVME